MVQKICCLLAASAALLISSVPSGAAVDPSLLALLPSNPSLVCGIQADRGRATQFGQYLLSHMSDVDHDSGVQQFIQDTGFDPRRDLESFLIVTTGGSNQSGFAVVARGNFDKAQIEKSLVARHQTVQQIGGMDVVFSGKGRKGKPNDEVGIAFVGPGLAVFGHRATLENIIANRNTPSVLDATVTKAIRKLSETNEVWFASFVPASQLMPGGSEKAHEDNAQSRVLLAVTQFTGGIRFADDLKFTLDVVSRSAQDAVSLADVIRMGASMVQTQRDNKDPRAGILATAFDSMALTTTGTTTHLGLSLPEKSLEKLIAKDIVSADFGFSLHSDE